MRLKIKRQKDLCQEKIKSRGEETQREQKVKHQLVDQKGIKNSKRMIMEAILKDITTKVMKIYGKHGESEKNNSERQ